MLIDKMDMPEDIKETLKDCFTKLRIGSPHLTESQFYYGIFKTFLKDYKTNPKPIYNKQDVKLRSKIDYAVSWSGKSMTQIAREIGITRSYLGRLCHEAYDPTVTVALLVLYATGYPLSRIEDIFYFEPK